MTNVSIDRCRRLIDELRRSPDEKTDRKLIGAFEKELNELEFPQPAQLEGQLELSMEHFR